MTVIFKIYNDTKGTKAGVGETLFADIGDSISLYHYNDEVPVGTNIRFYNRTLQQYVSTSGGQTLNSEHWCNPWWNYKTDGYGNDVNFQSANIYSWNENNYQTTGDIYVTFKTYNYTANVVQGYGGINAYRNGTYIGAQGTYSYFKGDEVKFDAIPSTGSTFSQWCYPSGACTTSNPYEVTCDGVYSSTTVNAYFISVAEGDIVVQSVSASSNPVTSGGNVTITANLKNDGDTSVTETVYLKSDGNGIDYESKTVAAHSTGTATWTKVAGSSNGFAVGTHNICAFTSGDEKCTSLTVNALKVINYSTFARYVTGGCIEFDACTVDANTATGNVQIVVNYTVDPPGTYTVEIEYSINGVNTIYGLQGNFSGTAQKCITNTDHNYEAGKTYKIVSIKFL